jgi:hypothetical protein
VKLFKLISKADSLPNATNAKQEIEGSQETQDGKHAAKNSTLFVPETVHVKEESRKKIATNYHSND